MKVRTEDEILSQAPLKVKLGAADYEIKILNVTQTRLWRIKLSESMGAIMAQFTGKTPDVSTSPGDLIATLVLQFPEKLADLIFAYAPDLPKDKILDEASEEHIALAFSAIMSIAFPFGPQLGTMVQLAQGMRQTQA